MTKQQEILRLNATIKALGPDSYLGPWLATVRAEVESNIRSDMFPTILPSEIKAQADNEAKNIIERAEQKAKLMVMDAEREVEKLRRNMDLIRAEARPLFNSLSNFING